MQKDNNLNAVGHDGEQTAPSTGEEDIVRKIAARIRSIRLNKHLTIQQLAERAEVTKGLLSKIENSRTIPSLPVFIKILKSLDITFHEFFLEIQGQKDKRWLLLRNQKTQVATAPPFSLPNGSLPDQRSTGSKLEMSMLQIKPQVTPEFIVLPFCRFIHVTTGRVEYHTSTDIIHLHAGDALYFDGSISHMLINPSDREASLLVIDFRN